MPYELPTVPFDAVEHAKNRVLRANQFEVLVLQQFKEMYHDFWGVSEPPTGSRYTVAEMQAVLDAMPMSTAVDMMTDAATFYGFVLQAYPGAMPEQYGTAAFNYTISQTGITLTGLKSVWETPPEEDEQTP
jgi:hypothetical protein